MQTPGTVLQYILEGSRGGNGAQASLASAAAQLGVLSSAQQPEEVVGELCTRAQAMLGSKQVRASHQVHIHAAARALRAGAGLEEAAPPPRRPAPPPSRAQAAARRQGLELLRVLAADSDRRTFLAGQQEWFGAVLALLRAGDQPAEVQRAGWACLAALFSRLGRMLDIPGVRRDGAALVPKLVALLQQRCAQQQQQQEQEQGAGAAPPAALDPGAMQALLAATTALPAPFRAHLRFLEPLVCTALTAPALPPGALR